MAWGRDQVRQSGAVTSETVVASANILRDLRSGLARVALAGVLDEGPDLVALQEWGPKRAGLLLESGSVGVLPHVPVRIGSGYQVWSTPLLGGCAVGAKAARYDVLRVRSVVLSRPGPADKPDRPFGIEPPRIATMATHRDRITGRIVVLLNYHLVPGVQGDHSYRDDRPLLAARHQAEVRRLEQLIAGQLAQGHVVYAAGDANFDGLQLAGLTSAWEGRADEPGTLGDDRKIDDVFGPGRPTSVALLVNASDHKAVVVRRADG